MSSRIPLDQIPTVALLYRTKRLQVHPTAVHEPNVVFNSKIGLIRYDITKLEIDSIVNAANESLLGGGGVDGAIHRAAGPQLVRECEILNGCTTGNAKITNGYRLPARKVIHAVGPVYWKEKRQGKHEELLRGCYRRSLELCEKHGLRSIAFSALSTGVYGYPSNEAAEAAVSEVRNFFQEGNGKNIDRVVFCNFMEKDEDAYRVILPKFFPPEQANEATAKASKEPESAASIGKTAGKETTTGDKNAAEKENTAHQEKLESPATQTSGSKSQPATTAAGIAKLPGPPKEEPEAKKLKTTDKPENDDATIKDDDWVEIDKSSIPHQPSVEEVEDEDDKTKA